MTIRVLRVPVRAKTNKAIYYLYLSSFIPSWEFSVQYCIVVSNVSEFKDWKVKVFQLLKKRSNNSMACIDIALWTTPRIPTWIPPPGCPLSYWPPAGTWSTISTSGPTGTLTAPGGKKIDFFEKKPFFWDTLSDFFSRAKKGGHRFWKTVQNRVNKHLTLKSRDANYAYKYWELLRSTWHLLKQEGKS